MEPEKEVSQCYEQMNIVEKYETVIAYLYPIAQNIPRKHGVAKAMFLGFRIWPRHKLLRKRSVVGAKRKIKRYLNSNDHESLDRFIASWRGHAAHADTCNLFNHLENCYGIHCHQHP